MKKLLITTSLIGLLSLPVIAAQPEVNQIEQATATMNLTELQRLTQSTQGYDQALAHYRLGLSQNIMGQRDNAKQQLAKAQAALTSLIEQAEQSSEADETLGEYYALLGQVYGYQTVLHPVKSAYYGFKAQQTLAKAKALAPQSPRVYLVDGIGAYNTPSMFGGSKSKALADMTRAIALYAEDDKQSGYYWGLAEAHTWQGLAYSDLQQVEKAKQSWQHALAVNPNYGWAKMLLSAQAK